MKLSLLKGPQSNDTDEDGAVGRSRSKMTMINSIAGNQSLPPRLNNIRALNGDHDPSAPLPSPPLPPGTAPEIPPSATIAVAITIIVYSHDHHHDVLFLRQWLPSIDCPPCAERLPNIISENLQGHY
mmetsp:Transcript_9253/g.20872  ORF Transcript_9253/g.20872 Transcript_9253/m.20872 type:complete len:127 (-) Transcript_9253:32-412(-)